MKQAVVLVCMALCLSAAVAADTEEPKGLMRSLFPSKASAMSGSYGVERESMCFKTTSYCTESNDSSDNIKIRLRDFNLACMTCPEDQHYSHYEGRVDGAPREEITPPLHKCSMSIQEFSEADCTLVSNTPGLTWCGTYYGQCRLSKEHACSLPGAHEDTVVQIEGMIYRVTQAIKVGPASTISANASCAPASAAVASFQEPVTEGPASKARVYSYGEGDKTVVVGKASIYDGTFTVRSLNPMKVISGVHRYTAYTPPPSSSAPIAFEDALHIVRVPDRVHRFDYGVPEGPSKRPYRL